MHKERLKQIAEFAYKTIFRQAATLSKIEQTFYGWVVFLGSGKSRVVVKFSREVGRLVLELDGLQRLRKSVSCKVPEVLFFGREDGHDYLMLEWVDGMPAHKLPATPMAISAFRDSYVDVLLEMHEHSAEGYEIPKQGFTDSFDSAFEHWMSPVYRYVMSEYSPFTPHLREIYGQLWESRADILSELKGAPSLIHDDCHIGNVLFDPKTFKVSAVLDPCDVGFRHREMDLFHLYDVRPELGLVEHYCKHVTLDDGFELRRWFFSLWDDAKHSRNMGWFDAQWLEGKVAKMHQYRPFSQ
ncbi:phosphotransferase [Photobacterium aquae]|uniref:Phosphotransferase n=1 Tax=Photobacterium aquae TaxID=1195763 RepID=A0A0J1JPJ0_9GAMM|nr:phosphotransferase [Photobacterium aquae]KLV04152.1 phosphotransferase [Photobacterium aquae]